jgi:ABC-type methionine transport system ATPase subunit
MIKIFHLTKSFPAKGVVFDELALRIPPGQFVVLSGDSGCGKSSLLRIIAGLVAPDSGQVIVAGRKLEGLDETEQVALRREVSLVPQEVSLLPGRNVAENISFALRVRDVSRRQVKTLCARWLDTFGLSELASAAPEELALGEQVKLMLARALAVGPKLLLIDEPTASLDASSTRAVISIICEAHGKGLTTVLATKDPSIRLNLAARVILLKDGTASEKY